METSELEISDKRGKGSPSRMLFERIKNAESRGFKIRGSVDFNELEKFEIRSGIVPAQEKRDYQVKPKTSFTLTPAQREKISKRLRDDAELEQYRKDIQPERAARRKAIENELKLKKIGLYMETEEKATTVFL